MKHLKQALAAMVASAVCLALLAGCSGGGEDISSGAAREDYPVTVSDVTINEEPQEVVVLSQNLADVILAMNYEFSLVGRSAECTQSDLSVVPVMTITDVDTMREAGVDLVLVDEEPSAEQTEALTQQGIQTLVIPEATSREDLHRLYTQVGSALKGGRTGYTQAEQSLNNILLALDDITRDIPQSETRPIGCYIYNLEGSVATGDTMAGRLIEYAGMVNNFSSDTGGQSAMLPIGGDGSELAVSGLVVGNPDYIFCDEAVREELIASSLYQDLSAVQNNRVYVVPSYLMQRQGLSLVTATSILANYVYPDTFNEDVSRLLEIDGTASSAVSESPASSASSETASSSAPSSTASSSTSSTSSTTVDTPSSVPETQIAEEGVLQEGDQGEEVVRLQQRLQELGFMNYGTVNGVFSASTTQFVKDFQLYNNLLATGIVNEATREALYSADAVPADY